MCEEKEVSFIETQVTIKVKLKLQSSQLASDFTETMEQYRRACNFISDYVFNHNFEFNQNRLNKALYTEIRERFRLKSQMTQSAIRTVVARYKTLQIQLARKQYNYQDINVGKWYHTTVDLSWLQKPITFNRPQVDLQRNRDWSYLAKTQQLSMNTLNGRVKVTPVCHGFDQYFKGDWHFGLAKLLKSGNKWYLHISATKELPDFNKKRVKHVVGIDRGLRFLATTYDEKNKTNFYSGKSIMRKQAKYQRLRTQLCSKGTKSAKRRLKKILIRENRWMTDINHQLSKTLVSNYGDNTLFVLENLDGTVFERNNLSKMNCSSRKSWKFYQLEQFLTYKAHINGSEVIKVPAQYTSQRCPKCGIIRKDNRNHHLHEYHCHNCGYISNDDRSGAMNIQELGKMYVSKNESPRFKN